MRYFWSGREVRILRTTRFNLTRVQFLDNGEETWISTMDLEFAS